MKIEIEMTELIALIKAFWFAPSEPVVTWEEEKPTVKFNEGKV